MGLMVLGDPRPILARTLSIVGRSPERRSESAAWETSDCEMPRGGGPRGLVGVRDSIMGEIIHHMYSIIFNTYILLIIATITS
jgi:hypothetical protein